MIIRDQEYAQKALEAAAVTANVGPKDVYNYVTVVYFKDDNGNLIMRISSSDPHNTCLVKMLTEAATSITEDDEEFLKTTPGTRISVDIIDGELVTFIDGVRVG